jgi:outer membrane receptor protein involved in Fe transport
LGFFAGVVPVGTYINEIPVTDYFFSVSNFDMGGFDLDRVEFLKGPQGTMFGAASLGGTMRYILNKPNMGRHEGALHLTTAVVEDGGVNWVAQGMFNVVLADGKFALRGVAGYEDNSGWINNAYLQEDDWNFYDQTNLRLMASWMPTDKVRLDFTYLQRDSDLNDGIALVDGPDLDNPAVATDDGGTISYFQPMEQSIADAVDAVAPGVGSLLYPNDIWVDVWWIDDATELSLYADFGLDLSDRWKLTFGGRYTDWQKDSAIQFSQFGIPAPITNPPTFDEQIFSPKVSIAFRASDDTLWYGLASKGYRTGGANMSYIGSGLTDPNFFSYETDNLWNYEAGVKKSWSGGKLITDFTVYYLDWQDIQLEALFADPNSPAYINSVYNTSAAHSLGVEATINVQLAPGLTFYTAIAWAEAELDEPTPELLDRFTFEPIVVSAGTPLPSTPEWSTFSTLQ